MAEDRDRLREPGVIDRVFLGREDHGILTCSIGIDFGGSHQSFGGVCLDENTAQDFVRSLCCVFDVQKLDDLKGLKCYALRCFDSHNCDIEGLEAVSGWRFLLTAWRRRHWPETKNPLEYARERLEKDIEYFKRRIQETKNSLATVGARYRSWESLPVKKRRRRG